MADPAISVLLPVFNGEPYLAQAIDSILAQTFSDFELLVVDDGSEDSSSDTIARYAAADSRIRPITFIDNVGIIGALNRSLAEARAPLVARMDSDDLSLPHRFATQREAIERTGHVALAGGYFQIDATGAMDGKVHLPDATLAARLDQVPYLEPYLPHPFLMARTEAMRAIGGYRYAYHAEDADLFWRLMEYGTISNVRDYIGYYRVHSGAISGRGAASARMQALYSQLAGLAADRRRQGLPDIPFTAEGVAYIARRAYSLESIVAAAQSAFAIETDELPSLAARVVAKYLEYTSWRPFDIEMEDADYICATVRRYLAGSPRNSSRAYVKRLWIGAAHRVRAFNDSIGDRLIGAAGSRSFAKLRARWA